MIYSTIRVSKLAWNWLTSFDLEDIKIGGRPDEKFFSPGSLEGKAQYDDNDNDKKSYFDPINAKL